ncbi:MAG: hypothetical protein KDJ38_14465 [Gammaproteobacteria bacterium]|nr:hypothetical protein [Gammaproteobacteria bacterium]
MITSRSCIQKTACRTLLAGALATAGTTAAFAAPDQAQTDALNALYTSLNGANWVDNTGWNTDTDPCSWFGVTCDGAGANVTQINLQDNRLVGTIPASITDLSQLQILVLQNNSLGGFSIPAVLGSMTQLRELYLNDTGLQGAIPAELGQLTNLRTLALDDNRLSGQIPAELGNLVNLVNLRLYGNLLTGPVPASFGNLTELRNLGLNRNALAGLIPSELVNLSALETLNLDWNALHSTDATLNTFINQKADVTWETTDYIDTQTLDAAVRPSVVGETAIRLQWDQRNTTPATEGGYKIYQASAPEGPYVFLKKVPLKQSSSTLVDNLQAATTYYYQVRSYTDDNPLHILPFDLDSDGGFYDPHEVTTLAAGSGNANVDMTPDAEEPGDNTGTGGTDNGNGSSSGGGGGALAYLLFVLLGTMLRRSAYRRDA